MSEYLMPYFCNRRFPFHYTTALCVLMKMGLDITQVDILAIGEFENYKGEVLEQEPAPGRVITAETTVRLKVGYPSAVDFMPYQFFYGLTGSGARSSDWERSGARAHGAL